MNRKVMTMIAVLVTMSFSAFAQNRQSRSALPEYQSGSVEDMKALRAKCWTAPTVDMKMRFIPAGSFVMGSPGSEIGHREDETQHKVTICEPFYMGIYEVTQEQFYDLMLPEDYDYDAWQYNRGPLHDGLAFCYRYKKEGGLLFHGGAVGDDLTLNNPMECVSWVRAEAFSRKLTAKERQAGRLPEGYVYRLPTEAEWEYACRAGTEGPYNVDGPYEKLKDIQRFAYVKIFEMVRYGTAPVGEDRKPNAWGLYDMHGNVYEWCRDWYGPYANQPQTDPTGPTEGRKRVARGGSYTCAWTEKADMKRIGMPLDDAEDKLGTYVHPFLRSASRYGFAPVTDFYAILGFRVVLAKQY